MKQIVTVVKTIQIRYETDDGYDGWNKRFVKPTAAAKEWSLTKAIDWRQKTFRHTVITSADYNLISELVEKRQKRYYDKVLSIFKAMVK